MMLNKVHYKSFTTPIGRLRIMASDKGLTAVLFGDGQKYKIMGDVTLEENEDHPVLLRAEKQLHEYFAGKRQTFDIKLDVRGTIFQMKAWHELQKIPYSQTITYGEQARRVGDAKKARAIGHANGRNPIAIIIPCHRVIGASGTMTGFAGGIPVKEFLLKHESGTQG